MIGGLPAAAVCAWIVAAEPAASNALSSRPEIERWVDASSAGAGNGTAERPFKTLDAAFGEPGESRLRIHLAAGLYRGPFHPATSTRIEGTGTAVLFAQSSDVVLASRARLELVNVMIQGGAVGIEASGELILRGVSFSGQRKIGAHVLNGSLFAERSTFSASVSEAGAVAIEASRAVLQRSAFRGPYRRALELKGPGRLDLTDCLFDGTVTGLHLVGGSAAVHRTSFAGGRGPAVFVARGTLELVDVDVFGHEYGLQCGESASVRALRFSSVRADRAGIALARATAELEEITIAESGSFGAIQLVDSTLALRRFRFQRPEAYGLLGRHSRISVSDGAITDVVDSGGSAGDGIHLRGSRGSIESVLVLRSAGAGLLAAEDSMLEVRDFAVERCHWGGVVAESLARVRGSSWMIRRCDAPALAVPDVGEVDVDVLRSEGNTHGSLWVECARGGRARVSRAGGDPIEARSSACAELVP